MLSRKYIIILVVSILFIVVSLYGFFLLSKPSSNDIYNLNTEIQFSTPNSPKVIGNYYKQSNESYSGKVTVFFVGTEYCTFCAAQRWPLVESLKKFGSFEGLKSSSTPNIGGEYSNLPTYTFVETNYTSSYIMFSHKETYDKEYNELEGLSDEERKIVDKYNPFGGVPFLMIAGKKGVYTQVSSGYSPGVLSGLKFSEVQNNLKNNADKKEVSSIDHEANIITAIICYNNENLPENVCNQPEIRILIQKII